MRSSWLFVTGAVLYLAPAIWASARARRELLSQHAISRATLMAAVLAYGSLLCAILLAAWWEAWSLPMDRSMSRIAGVATAILGATIQLSGRLKFSSFQRAWGLAMPTLITTGIYRYIRHPQNLGWGLLFLSAAIAGRSGVALALTLIYAATCVPWLRVGDQALGKRFGSDYLEYRKSTGAVLPPLDRLFARRWGARQQASAVDGKTPPP